MLTVSNATPHDLARQALLEVDRARLIGDGIRHVAHWAAEGFRKVAQIVQQRAERARVVDQLYQLDDRMLSDIGLSRADIRTAVERGAAANRAQAPAPTPVEQDNRPAARAA